MSDRLKLDDQCPGCGMSWWLFPPTRVNEDRGIDRHPRFAPGPYVRCVECKREYLRPLAHAVSSSATPTESKP